MGKFSDLNVEILEFAVEICKKYNIVYEHVADGLVPFAIEEEVCDGIMERFSIDIGTEYYTDLMYEAINYIEEENKMPEDVVVTKEAKVTLLIAVVCGGEPYVYKNAEIMGIDPDTKLLMFKCNGFNYTFNMDQIEYIATKPSEDDSQTEEPKNDKVDTVV